MIQAEEGAEEGAEGEEQVGEVGESGERIWVKHDPDLESRTGRHWPLQLEWFAASLENNNSMLSHLVMKVC